MEPGDRTALPETSDDLVSYRTLVIGLVLAVVAAIAATVMVFILADGAGAFPDSVQIDRMNGEKGPMKASDVVVGVLLGWAIGAIVLLALRAFTRRPLGIFWVVATIGTLLSLASPFTIDGAPGDMLVALLAMHLVAAVTGCFVLNQVVQRASV